MLAQQLQAQEDQIAREMERLELRESDISQSENAVRRDYGDDYDRDRRPAQRQSHLQVRPRNSDDVRRPLANQSSSGRRPAASTIDKTKKDPKNCIIM